MGKKKQKKKKYNVVPFQLCPKCNGSGSVSQYTLNATTTSLTNSCDLCYGSKVIPQAMIPKAKKQ